MKTLFAAAFVAALLAGTMAWGCSGDDQCGPGMKCIRNPSQSAGICIEGDLTEREPADKGAESPQMETPDRQEARRHPCSDDYQCDPGEDCFRPPSETYGICIRKK